MNLTATTDTAPEAEAERKRRRRWWLIILFLILASVVVFGVFVFTEGEQPAYRFLTQARPISVREFIGDAGHSPNHWLRMAEFQSDQPVDILAEKARKELPPSEWTERRQPGQFVIFDNRRLQKAVLIVNEQSVTLITVGQSRPATVLDRIRLWFRDFGRQEAKPGDAGSP